MVFSFQGIFLKVREGTGWKVEHCLKTAVLPSCSLIYAFYYYCFSVRFRKYLSVWNPSAFSEVGKCIYRGLYQSFSIGRRHRVFATGDSSRVFTVTVLFHAGLCWSDTTGCWWTGHKQAWRPTSGRHLEWRHAHHDFHHLTYKCGCFRVWNGTFRHQAERSLSSTKVIDWLDHQHFSTPLST